MGGWELPTGNFKSSITDKLSSQLLISSPQLSFASISREPRKALLFSRLSSRSLSLGPANPSLM